MPKIVDLTGQRFGKLTVIEKTDERHNGSVIYKCKCDCGNYKNIPSPYLKKGHAKSCGCFDRNDLTGQSFGRLIAIKDTGKRSHSFAIWLCKCDCGNEKETLSISLTSGRTKSCGCIARENGYEKIKTFDQSKSSLIANENQCKEGTKLCNLTMKTPKDNKSGIKGVFYDKSRNRFMAYITFKKQTINLGRFDTLEEAAQARKEAEEKYFKPILEKYEER